MNQKGEITQISYRYGVGMYKGTDEFKDALQLHYNVHEKAKWMPAAGGNFEMWLDIFINSPIVDFFKDAIIGNAIYDITKSLIIKPFIEALHNLEKANDYPLEIQRYTFEFEDTTVIIGGISTNFTTVFSAIFQELLQQYNKIKEDLKANNIFQIRIPVNPEDGKDIYIESPIPSEDYLKYWFVSYDYGIEFTIWDVKNRSKYIGTT